MSVLLGAAKKVAREARSMAIRSMRVGARLLDELSVYRSALAKAQTDLMDREAKLADRETELRRTRELVFRLKPRGAITASPEPAYFIITSNGRTATYWLASRLNGHPDILCSHGPVAAPVTDYPDRQPEEQCLHAWAHLDEFLSLSLDEYFDSLVKAGRYRVYGSVHAYTANHMAHTMQSAPPKRIIALVDLTRHPVTRCESYKNRWLHVISFNPHTAAWIDDSFTKLNSTVDNILEFFNVDFDRIEHRVFLVALHHFELDFSNVLAPVPRLPMERLTRDPESFLWLFRYVTQGRADIDQDFLKEAFSVGRMNVESKKALSSVELFHRWEDWKKWAFVVTAEKLFFEQIYDGYFYDFSFCWKWMEQWRASRGKKARDDSP